MSATRLANEHRCLRARCRLLGLDGWDVVELERLEQVVEIVDVVVHVTSRRLSVSSIIGTGLTGLDATLVRYCATIMLIAATRGTEAWNFGNAVGAAVLLVAAAIFVVWIIRVILR